MFALNIHDQNGFCCTYCLNTFLGQIQKTTNQRTETRAPALLVKRFWILTLHQNITNCKDHFTLCWLQINQKYPEKGFLQLLSASEFGKMQMFGTLCSWLQSLQLTGRAVDFVFLLSKEDTGFFCTEPVWLRQKGEFLFCSPHRPTSLACKVLSLADGVQSLHAVREFATSVQAHGSRASARNCHDQSGYLPGQMESNTYFIRFKDRLDP